MRGLLAKVLREDAQVITADSGTSAIAKLRTQRVDVVLCDLRMPDLDGLEVLKECRKLSGRTEFVLMTAYASVDTAVEALRRGAFDYLTKPFEPEVARVVVLRAAGRVPRSPSFSLDGDEVLPGVISRAPVMGELADMVRQVAASDATVLLLGETGTGKERLARAVHLLSPRQSARFIAINCAAIPANLLESELFGYVKGAFTGAARNKAGLFEESDGGTLFLDEIRDMPLSLQAKLTRALEERAIRRLGDSEERPIDTRIIAATHRHIEEMVAAETFREDLWYRLNVAAIRIPPLRERAEDIELLATHFLRERAISNERRLSGFTDAAISALNKFHWPGNVRQLRAAIERASVVCRDERVDVGDLPPEVVGLGKEEALDRSSLSWAQAQKLGQSQIARQYLEDVLRRFDGNVSNAAEHAGVERESFYRLMRRYGVDATKTKK